ncbi:unnamed protein product [Caenorhabditis bovis]|uniref:Sulfide:quinone oxidoreductase, mitochondrial n=1 Tax=Caenorhabditis bovis TaxID=2654633 RepID=A0A8S1F1N9_9PELO|nr:unnamed protein product [Caenorhabditis bovis]
MKKSCVALANRHFQLLVVGGGAGGCGAASKFARVLPKNAVAIVEPHEEHYYQPGFTLVGGGLMSLEANRRQQSSVIPKNTVWIQDLVERFEPAENRVTLSNGDQVSYDYMVVAVGVSLRYDMIKGALEALETPGVCSNYSPKYVEKTFKEASIFQSGNAVFTFPNTPIKCAGAPQKVCYITESILQKRGVRQNANVIYATSLGRLFGVEKYLKPLEKVAREKNVDVRTRHNLIEVDHRNKLAIFELLDDNCNSKGKFDTIEYSMLHIAPPCTTPEALRTSELVDATGFMDVDHLSLQSKKFANVFGVGDCMNTSNAKTAAAVSSHLKTIEKNLKAKFAGKQMTAEYDGYASCPLVVSTNRAILAEFGPEGRMESTPFDQSKPSYWAYLMKRYFMPFLYWNGLVRGYWNGPAAIRRVSKLFRRVNE